MVNQSPCLSILGVAYDSHRNIFYWAIDGGATRLRQLTGGDTESSELSLVANPSSVALDYIGQRLYWIEEIRENGVSLVCVSIKDTRTNNSSQL